MAVNLGKPRIMSPTTVISFIFIICTITYVIESKSLRPVFTADCSHGYCYFSNLNLTKVTYFEVTSNIPASKVTFVSLGGGQDGSKMHTLTSQFCDKFPNVVEMAACNLGLAQIEPNAFVGCTKLERLDLSGNNLKSLELGLFGNYDKLKELSVSNNQLKEVDEVEFVKKFPKLKSFRLCPNDKIRTNRLMQIAKYIKDSRIKFYELDYC